MVNLPDRTTLLIAWISSSPHELLANSYAMKPFLLTQIKYGSLRLHSAMIPGRRQCGPTTNTHENISRSAIARCDILRTTHPYWERDKERGLSSTHALTMAAIFRGEGVTFSRLAATPQTRSSSPRAWTYTPVKCMSS